MTHSAQELIRQTVLYRLSTDEELMSKVTGVFDEVPEAQPFPYVTIGRMHASSARTWSRLAEDVMVTLHIWSEATGFAQAHGVLDDLNRLLADQDLTGLDDEKVVSRFVESEAMMDPDNPDRKVSTSYRLFVSQS